MVLSFNFQSIKLSDQIDFIESIGFRDILCLTVPDLKNIQPAAFLTPGEYNAKEVCNVKLNLQDWKLIGEPTVPKHVNEGPEEFILPKV